ncbi:MAG TPA: hemolysin III family protein [Burkholderiaceae bacterium]|nr:hemolysin III family protein [Burkholderiaceae bacterium]
MYRGERLNSITHLVGTALAVAGSAIMIALAAIEGDPWKVVSFSIFGAMLITLYAISTLYHSLRGRAKDVFRKLDHCAIYLLIAGTYTPFTLVTLRGTLGWSMFGAIWGLAVIGVVQELLFARGARWLSLVLYLLMGWLGAAAAMPLIDTLGTNGMAWLAAGGALYTGGIVFYLFDEQWRHAHGIWHLFVMAGSASHFIAVMFFVG